MSSQGPVWLNLKVSGFAFCRGSRSLCKIFRALASSAKRNAPASLAGRDGTTPRTMFAPVPVETLAGGLSTVPKLLAARCFSSCRCGRPPTTQRQRRGVVDRLTQGSWQLGKSLARLRGHLVQQAEYADHHGSIVRRPEADGEIANLSRIQGSHLTIERFFLFAPRALSATRIRLAPSLRFVRTTI